jgi:signal transduction histidine kinase
MKEQRSKRPPSDDSAIRNYPGLLKRYARLLEITSQMASTLELGTLLQHISDAAKELTESQASSILLYDSTTNHLYFEAVTGPLEEEFTRTAVPADSSIAGWIFTNGEPLLVEDTHNDPRFFAEVDVQTTFHTRSILGVPLQTKEKTLGVIEAVNKDRGVFNEEDQRLLEALAAQAAIAIDNSRLFQQSDLVAEMVHELRTPLAALMAAAHLLQRPELAKDQSTKLTETVYSEVQRLNDMTTDFLELARLESGRVQFVREPVHLEGLTHECLEIIRPQAAGQGISIDTVFDRSVSPVQGDRNRLKQLLLNLLTNAVKYNVKDGNVHVELNKEGNDLFLSVQDTGRGIPAESLPHIFERFYRVPDQESQVSGTGLGLVIAQRIAHNHQGQIEVESEVGKGSTFTLRLPSSGIEATRRRSPK